MHNLQIAVEVSMASAVDIDDDSLLREMYFGRVLSGLLAPPKLMVFFHGRLTSLG